MNDDVSHHAACFRKIVEVKGIALTEDQTAIAHQIFSKGRGTGKSFLIALLAMSDEDHAENVKSIEGKK